MQCSVSWATFATVSLTAALCACAACGDGDDFGAERPRPAIITIANQSGGQAGRVGRELPRSISTHVVDNDGSLSTNTVVLWRVAPGNGTIDVEMSPTNANGDATVHWTLGTAAKIDTLTAELTSGRSITITASARAGEAVDLMAVSGNNQNSAAGFMSAPLVVMAIDQYQNPVANAVVTWRSFSGGTLSALSGMTNAAGLTQITVVTNATPSVYTLAVQMVGSIPLTFTVYSR